MSAFVPADDRPARHSTLVAAAALTLGLIGITVLFAATAAGARWNGDLQLFLTHAQAFVHGTVSQTPYLTWYPPLSLAPITLPLLGGSDIGTYTFLFASEMAAVGGVMVAVTGVSGRRLRAWGPVASVVVLSFVLAALIPWRYDALPALATAGALAAALSGEFLLAGALIGIGMALKLYPVVLLPVLLAWAWMRGQRAGAALALIGFALAAGIGFGLYVFFPPRVPTDLLAFQGSRGLQLESLPASVIALAAILGVASRPTIAFGDGSYNMLGADADTGVRILSVAEPLLVLVALLVIGSRLWRDRGDVRPQTLAQGFALVLLALILGNKVFSPQYLIWLLPFVALLPGRFRVGFGLAFVLTAVIFPFLYDRLIGLETLPVVLLLLRNVVLGVLFVALSLGILRERREWDLSAVDPE